MARQSEWIDLRADNGRLYGRLNRATLDLQIVQGDREILFDLVATARDGCAVSEHRVIARPGVGGGQKKTPPG